MRACNGDIDAIGWCCHGTALGCRHLGTLQIVQGDGAVVGNRHLAAVHRDGRLGRVDVVDTARGEVYQAAIPDEIGTFAVESQSGLTGSRILGSLVIVVEDYLTID